MTIKSEAEARKCWCPFVRLTIGAASSVGLAIYDQSFNTIMFDNEVQPLPASNCRGSRCMAWRPEGQLARGETAPGPDWIQTGVNEAGEPTWFLAAGYCGLAGKP